MKTAINLLRKSAPVSLAALSTLFVTSTAFASGGGGGLPWEGPIQQMTDSLTGPVARNAAILLICGTGLACALTEGSTLVRKLLVIACCLSVTFGAASFFLAFFAGGSAATF